MNPDIMGRPAPDHFGPVIGITQNEFGRDQILFEDRTRPVDIAQKEIERIDALNEAGLQPGPFGARDQTGNDVERNEAFGRVLVAINAESDADPAKHIFGLGAARRQHVGWGFL